MSRIKRCVQHVTPGPGPEQRPFIFPCMFPCFGIGIIFGLGRPYLAADRFHNSQFFPVAQGKSLVVFYTVSRDVFCFAIRLDRHFSCMFWLTTSPTTIHGPTTSL